MKPASIATLALLALAACHKPATTAPAGTPTTTPSISAGLAIKSGRLVLPAVPGNPAAAYFTLVNNGPNDVTITGISIDATKQAMMHETSGDTMKMLDSVTVPSQGFVSFAPGGKHVMVFGIDAKLNAGGTAHAMLTSREGSIYSTDLKITAAADAGVADMGGMK